MPATGCQIHRVDRISLDRVHRRPRDRFGVSAQGQLLECVKWRPSGVEPIHHTYQVLRVRRNRATLSFVTQGRINLVLLAEIKKR